MEPLGGASYQECFRANAASLQWAGHPCCSRCISTKVFFASFKSILNDEKKGSGDTSNASNETTSATNNASNKTTSTTNNASNETTSVIITVTTRSSDTYVYGFGILAVLAIGVCVFFAYNTFQPKNKKLVNERQDQPPIKRRQYIYNKRQKYIQ